MINVLKLNHVFLLSRYILSIEKAEEIEEYVGDLLQGTDGKKGHFINELLIRWRKTQRQSPDSTSVFPSKESFSTPGIELYTMNLAVKVKSLFHSTCRR